MELYLFCKHTQITHSCTNARENKQKNTALSLCVFIKHIRQKKTACEYMNRFWRLAYIPPIFNLAIFVHQSTISNKINRSTEKLFNTGESVFALRYDLHRYVIHSPVLASKLSFLWRMLEYNQVLHTKMSTRFVFFRCSV